MEELTKNGIFIAENKKNKQLKLFVIGQLSHPELYTNIFFELDVLYEKYQMIEVIINTPGGDMDTLEELLNALSKYEHVTTIGRGTIASAGFLLWASGDTRVVGKYSKYMVHRESSSMGGYQKTGESLHYLNTIDGMYSEMYKELLSPILTKAEMEKAEVTEIYFPYTTLLERGVCISEETYMKLSDNIKSEDVVVIGGVTYLFNPQVDGWVKINITVDNENPEVIKSIIQKMHEVPVEVEDKDIEINSNMLDKDEDINKEKIENMMKNMMKMIMESDKDIELMESGKDIELMESGKDIELMESDKDIELMESDKDIELMESDKDIELTEDNICNKVELKEKTDDQIDDQIDKYIDNLIDDVKNDDILEDPILQSIARGVISNLLPTQPEAHYIKATIDYLDKSFTITWSRDDDEIEIIELIIPKYLTLEEREQELKKREQDRLDLRAKDFDEEVKRSEEVLNSDYNIEYISKNEQNLKSKLRSKGERINDEISKVPKEVLDDINEIKEKVQKNLNEIYYNSTEDFNDKSSVESKHTDHKDFNSLNNNTYGPAKFL